MHHVIIEIKARCADAQRIRDILQARGARFLGADHQVDTYFPVRDGRLKLREGNVENALIYYRRPNQTGPKQSNVLLYETRPESGLKQILQAALGVLAVVDKRREIYFIENVKFHVDEVKDLGSFLEIEAIGHEGGQEGLRRQCEQFVDLLGISSDELLENSYCDMLTSR